MKLNTKFRRHEQGSILVLGLPAGHVALRGTYPKKRSADWNKAERQKFGTAAVTDYTAPDGALWLFKFGVSKENTPALTGFAEAEVRAPLSSNR